MATFTSSTFLGGAGRFDQQGEATWAAARDAAAADSVFDTYEVQSTIDGTYRIQRVFLPIDTSSIPATATITAVTLNFNARYEGGNTGTVLHLVQTSQATTSSKVLADFDLIAGIPGSTMTSGGSVATPDAALTAKSITGNATALTWIVKAGTTKLALVSVADVNNTLGPGQWATVTAPELVVTYTVPSSTEENSYSFFM